MSGDPTKLKGAKEISRQDILFAMARVPQSARIYFGSSDFKLYTIDLAAEKPEAAVVGEHSSYVTSVALAGPYVVSGSYDQKLLWFNAESHELVRTVAAHESRIRMLAASPDGKLLASVADDMVCRVWEAESGKCLHELRGHAAVTPHHYPSMLYAVCFSPDGKLLATGDKTGRVVIWNVADAQRRADLDAAGVYTWDPTQRRHSIGGVRSLAFSPDGKLLAVGGMGQVGNIDHPDAPGRLEVFDWAAQKKTHEIQTESKLKGMIEALAFHPDGSWVVGAGGGYAGFIAFFDLASSKVIFQDSAPMHVHGMSLAESSDTLYAVGHNKLVVWELKG